jgi:hypothetical protein
VEKRTFVGVFELGDCSLRDVETAGQLVLADRPAVAELVQLDLLEL